MAALATDQNIGTIADKQATPQGGVGPVLHAKQTLVHSPRGVRATFPVGTTDHHHYTRKSFSADLDGRRRHQRSTEAGETHRMDAAASRQQSHHRCLHIRSR